MTPAGQGAGLLVDVAPAPRLAGEEIEIGRVLDDIDAGPPFFKVVGVADPAALDFPVILVGQQETERTLQKRYVRRCAVSRKHRADRRRDAPGGPVWPMKGYFSYELKPTALSHDLFFQ